jgi:ribonuclease-3
VLLLPLDRIGGRKVHFQAEVALTPESAAISLHLSWPCDCHGPPRREGSAAAAHGALVAAALRQRSLRNETIAMSTDSATDVDSRRANLESCQSKVGHGFHDLSLLEGALTHASGVQHRLASNERMEFLGDAILGMVVCERLFQQYPQYSEGELTKIKSVVVSRETCARMSEAIGLEDHLILGKGMASDPQIPRSVLAAAFESLVAAIYLDGGLTAAEQFILLHVGPEIDAAVSCEFGGNFKSILQQLAQREFGVTPNYLMMDEKGPDHSKCFKVAAQIGSRRFAAAWGKSKKESEQRAAHNAISQLRGEPEPYPCEESLSEDNQVEEIDP